MSEANASEGKRQTGLATLRRCHAAFQVPPLKSSLKRLGSGFDLKYLSDQTIKERRGQNTAKLFGRKDVGGRVKHSLYSRNVLMLMHKRLELKTRIPPI